MRISPTTLYSACNIKKQEGAKNTPMVSFCAADEFISQPTSDYWTRRKEIQREYLPRIAELRKQEKQQWFDVCQRAYDAQYKSRDFVAYSNSLHRIPEMLESEGKARSIPILNDLLCKYMHNEHLDYMRTIRGPNCSAVISKDKKMAEDFLMLTEYYSKFRSPTYEDSYLSRKVGPYNKVYGLDFVYLPDKTGDSDDLADAVLKLLEKSKENYKKTGRETIITVENMEKLISTDNIRENISCMKDLMSSANEDYHAQLQFVITDFKKCNIGATASHRIRSIYDLDKAGILKEDVDFYVRYFNGEMIPVFDEITEIYREGGIENFKMRQELEGLKTEFKSKIKELDELYPKETRGVRRKLPKQAGEIMENTGATIENTAKKGKLGMAVAIISAACVAIGALVLYLKSKKPKAARVTQNAQYATGVDIENNKLDLNMDNFLNNIGSGKLV